jgi:P27 family predicted phage terminase small subunit
MPKRKPREQKALSGTLRPDRERPRAGGRLLTRRPPAPRDLAPAARGPWCELADAALQARVLRPATLPALRLAAESLAVYRKCLKRVLDGPLTSRGSKKQIRAAPATQLAATWWTRTMAALAQMGMTPRSRALVDAMPDAPEKQDPLRELLDRHAAAAKEVVQ